MPHANESAFLTLLANLFRAQGDAATADALVYKHKSTCARAISGEDHRRVLGLQRKGRLLDNRGAHEDAIGWLSGALMLIEDALGPDHVGIIEHLDDVARCKFNKGDYSSALPYYLRLLRLVELSYGKGDELATTVRARIDDCRNGQRTGDGVRRLQVQMSVMLRHAQAARSAAYKDTRDQLRVLADRLIARGRILAGIRLLERWITLRRCDSAPNSEGVIQDLRDFSVTLRSCGRQERAADALKAIVLLLNERPPYVRHAVDMKQALSDLASCLAAMGNSRSAQETTVLADSIVLPQTQD